MTTKLTIEIIYENNGKITMNRHFDVDDDSKPIEILLGRQTYNLIDGFFELIRVKETSDTQTD